jgi:hypothetical protein
MNLILIHYYFGFFLPKRILKASLNLMPSISATSPLDGGSTL